MRKLSEMLRFLPESEVGGWAAKFLEVIIQLRAADQSSP